MATVAGIQAEVAWEVGSALPAGPDPTSDVKPVIDAIAAQMPALWDVAAASAATAARPGTVTFVRLRRLYMKLAAIDALLGSRWSRVDVLLGGRSGARPSLNQEFGNLYKLRTSVVSEIKDARKEALAAGGPGGSQSAAAADILATAPVQPGRYVPPVPAGQPANLPVLGADDPNDPYFRGDPRALPLPPELAEGGLP